MDVIKVEKRNEQAKANQLRRSGLVPCCVYGGDLPESISIQMDQQTANKLFHSSTRSVRAVRWALSWTAGSSPRRSRKRRK